MADGILGSSAGHGRGHARLVLRRKAIVGSSACRAPIITDRCSVLRRPIRFLARVCQCASASPTAAANADFASLQHNRVITYHACAATQHSPVSLLIRQRPSQAADNFLLPSPPRPTHGICTKRSKMRVLPANRSATSRSFSPYIRAHWEIGIHCPEVTRFPDRRQYRAAYARDRR